MAILIPDTMGRACGGLCASCQRMYDFQSERLNFEFESLRPKESWDHKLRRLMAYFEEDTQLRDILITGGDALMSQNKTLRNILEAVYRMACRKRKANQARPDGEKYAELQRVRLGSRLPAYLPMRIDDQLVEVLKEFREKASAVGVKQFVIQTHFQSPLEVTPEAREAIRKILSAGWLITNQLVYTVAASRRGHTTRLRQVLNSLGVVCYYTFSVKGFGENYTVFTPNSRSMQEQQEEKLFGRMTAEQTAELDAALTGEGDTAGRIRRFVQSEAFAKICAAQQVLRELAFITALHAAEVLAAQGSPAPDTAPEVQVLVQGIADLVLVFPDHLELLDYKTDRRKTEADFLSAYRPQLNLYALAIDKRFAPKKVTYKGIYSLELGRLIEA